MSVRELIDRAYAQTFDDVPADVMTMARLCFLDTLGTALGGVAEPAASLVRDEFLADAGGGRAKVWGTERAGSSFAAALCNGTAAHALDFDDWAPGSRAHPSAVLVPAVLAVAEDVDARGREVLNAFVAGYEFQEAVGLLLGTQHYQRGFHSTATVGALGSAVAAGKLLGLDAQQFATAVNLAATQAAGLKSMFGSMAKPFHAGRAASTGVLSARLAKRGFTAGAEGFSGPQGFLDVFGPDGLLVNEAGDRSNDPSWHLLDVKFKEHASCFGTHAAIEAALRIRADTSFSVADIVDLSVTVAPELETVCLIPQPATPLEAKFSIAFTTALALTCGRVAESDLSPETVSSISVMAIAKSIRIEHAPSYHPLEVTTRVRLADGRNLEFHHDVAGRRWSSTPDELAPRLVEKFHSLVDGLTLAGTSGEIESAVLSLADDEPVTGLTGLLLAAPR